MVEGRWMGEQHSKNASVVGPLSEFVNTVCKANVSLARRHGSRKTGSQLSTFPKSPFNRSFSATPSGNFLLIG